MKRFFCVLMMAVLLLCSCGSQENEKAKNDIIEINYDKISRRNNRTVLMKKYPYLSESFEYFNLKDPESVPNWNIKYSLNNSTEPKVIFSFGNETEYYYNGVIYSATGEEDVSCVVPYDSSFNNMVTDVLKRDNTLNYVFYHQKEGFETSLGYAVSYWFTITHDVLDEFAYWDIGIGDTIKVDYNLNKEYEIIDYTYYIVSNPYTEKPTYTKILTSTTKFNDVFKFPDFIYEYDNAPKVTLTITENYQKQSQTIEKFTVPSNIRLSCVQLESENKLFTTPIPMPEQEWIFEENLTSGNVDLYIYHNDAPELEGLYDTEKEQ